MFSQFVFFVVEDCFRPRLPVRGSVGSFVSLLPLGKAMANSDSDRAREIFLNSRKAAKSQSFFGENG